MLNIANLMLFNVCWLLLTGECVRTHHVVLHVLGHGYCLLPLASSPSALMFTLLHFQVHEV